MREVTPGVYFATGNGNLVVFSNSLVIVTEEDVIVVDSHVTPAAGKALIDSIQNITSKPIRFLINTHIHFDHVYGNAAFPPEVSIVGHAWTRERLLDNPLQEHIYLDFMALTRKSIARLQKTLKDAKDPEDRARLERRLQIDQANLASMEETRVVAPNVTVSDTMTIHRPGRTIQVLFLGRGHTGGDLLVLLPEDRLLFTGDFMLSGPSYMGDAYIYDWIQTLEKMKQLDFDWILPGHGEPFSDRSTIDDFQRLLQAVWDQFAAFYTQGLTPEEAVQKIDLSKELAVYRSVPLHTQHIAPIVAEHVYQQVQEKARQQ